MFFPSFGYGQGHGIFFENYRCYSIATCGKEDKEKGDKIILPASAFEKLAQMTISYPMQFELRNEAVDPQQVTHVGVLEFTANEGRCYVPYWIMQNLLVPEGGIIAIKNVTLPLATFIKFRPQSVDFLDISNPKAVLESTLRNFSCMTKNDMICLPYNGKNYYLEVIDVQPKDACSIVEADVKVDFDAPVGYEEPKVVKDSAPQPFSADSTTKDAKKSKESTQELLARAQEAREKELQEQRAKYIAFGGQGQRVDGKVKNTSTTSPAPAAPPTVSVPKSTKWSTKGGGTWGQGRKLNG